MKHKHYDTIVAWAEGKKIEVFNDKRMCWEDVAACPYWVDSFQYRIKPEPKPDIVRQVVVEATSPMWIKVFESGKFLPPNLMLIFDGESGKLKSAEVL